MHSSDTRPADIAGLKAQLRAQSLVRRDGLAEADRQEGSLAICDRLDALLGNAPGVVSAFLPIRSEVDLRPLIGRLWARGVTVGLPVMRKPDLIFRRHEAGRSLVSLGFGTQGPGPEAGEVEPDAMLVPLSVFDRACERIGYGKAFYDITIAGLRARGRRPRLIGVAFSVQEAPSVPVEDHDIRLDAIVTEREVILAPPRA